MNSLLSAKWTREKEKMKMRAGISRSSSHVVIIMFSLVVISCCLIVVEGGACRAGGSVRGKKPPPAKCNKENNSDCCKQGQLYSIFQCLLPVTKRSMATLTLNSFVRGGDGRGASECDGKFHLEDSQHRWWHYQRDGSTGGRGATRASSSLATDGG